MECMMNMRRQVSIKNDLSESLQVAWSVGQAVAQKQPVSLAQVQRLPASLQRTVAFMQVESGFVTEGLSMFNGLPAEERRWAVEEMSIALVESGFVTEGL